MVRLIAALPLALLAGLGVGLGLWLLVSLIPRLSRPTLATRIAPYVIDVSADARDLLDRRTADPLPLFAAVFSPSFRRVRDAVDSILGGREQIARRLRQAGLTISVDSFRSRQLVWAAAGAIAALVLALALGSIQSVPIAAEAAAVLVAAVGGFVARDFLLQRAAAARIIRITKELPTVLEFLTLSLSAGEGILDAIRRVTRISRGELAVDLATVTHNVSSGAPIGESLTALSAQLQIAPLTRAIEQITGALERGTPLADVLRAQAQDARDEAKRELLELSGKKEVAMLVPLVFLILPITIAIAIFPGLFVLQLGF